MLLTVFLCLYVSICLRSCFRVRVSVFLEPSISLCECVREYFYVTVFLCSCLWVFTCPVCLMSISMRLYLISHFRNCVFGSMPLYRLLCISDCVSPSVILHVCVSLSKFCVSHSTRVYLCICVHRCTCTCFCAYIY